MTSPDTQPPSLPPAARAAFLTACIIPVLAAWAWGGLEPRTLLVLNGLAALLLLLLAFSPAPAGGSAFPWRDPVFYGGFLFLFYLLLQWANSGRILYYDVGWQRWTHSPPPVPGLPSGFTRADSGQLLAWFFPAWSLVLALRSRLFSGRALVSFLRLLAGASALLALFGLIRFAAGTDSLFGLRLDGPFFATFGYANHAAAFFLLTGALSAALLSRETLLPGRKRSPGMAAGLGGATLLNLAAANCSLSRAGVILSWVFALFAIGVALAFSWNALSKAAKVKSAAASLGLLMALVIGVIEMADARILGEFGLDPRHPARPGDARHLNLNLNGRGRLRELGWKVWSESPWFGTGGWGFRYRAAFHLAPEDWTLLGRKGWANVHCDPLQFASEFGIVGLATGLSALIPLGLALLLALPRGGSVAVLGAAGLGMVALLSLIDLPFRCPAILLTWCAIFAGLPRIGVRLAARSTSFPCHPETRFEEQS